MQTLKATWALKVNKTSGPGCYVYRPYRTSLLGFGLCLFYEEQRWAKLKVAPGWLTLKATALCYWIMQGIGNFVNEERIRVEKELNTRLKRPVVRPRWGLYVWLLWDNSTRSLSCDALMFFLQKTRGGSTQCTSNLSGLFARNFAQSLTRVLKIK